MLQKTARSAAASILLFILISAIHAQPRREEYLGEANVDGARDRDSIKVGAYKGTYRAIQLRVENNAIQFDRVVIVYGNGSRQEIPIRSKIPAGESTRVIDLPGDQRVIASLELWYGRANWGSRRPKVRLFGFR